MLIYFCITASFLKNCRKSDLRFQIFTIKYGNQLPLFGEMRGAMQGYI